MSHYDGMPTRWFLTTRLLISLKALKRFQQALAWMLWLTLAPFRFVLWLVGRQPLYDGMPHRWFVLTRQALLLGGAVGASAPERLTSALRQHEGKDAA